MLLKTGDMIINTDAIAYVEYRASYTAKSDNSTVEASLVITFAMRGDLNISGDEATALWETINQQDIKTVRS